MGARQNTRTSQSRSFSVRCCDGEHVTKHPPNAKRNPSVNCGLRVMTASRRRLIDCDKRATLGGRVPMAGGRARVRGGMSESPEPSAASRCEPKPSPQNENRALVEGARRPRPLGVRLLPPRPVSGTAAPDPGPSATVLGFTHRKGRSFCPGRGGPERRFLRSQRRALFVCLSFGSYTSRPSGNSVSQGLSSAAASTRPGPP